MNIWTEKNNLWNDFLESEFRKEYFYNLLCFLEKEYSTKNIFPDKKDVLNAFKLTHLNNIKVVILGQDPYPTRGMAMGLSFSVRNDNKIPPSLRNIYKEIISEYGYVKYDNGDLSHWAQQGVFLLNSILTVEEGKPLSHKNKGWECFTDNVISYLNTSLNPIVFVFWGDYSKSKENLITNKNHLILKSSHPSPLSARKSFFGCSHFLKINEFLRSVYNEEIEW